MCVVETKDAEQANKMKMALEEKYDHLTITTVGVALGVEDKSSTDDDTDENSDEGDEKYEESFGTLGVPQGPGRLSRRGSINNMAGGGLPIPIISHGRRGSAMVQTHIKTPEWKQPDTHKTTTIDWSNRATHYPVHSSH